MHSEFFLPAISLEPPTDYTGEIPYAKITESKLGGAPYQPAGTSWPTGMMFLAQLRLDELEAYRVAQGLSPLIGGHLPTIGMLQFFLPAEAGYGKFSPEPECHVRWISTTTEPTAAKTWWDGENMVSEVTDPERYAVDSPGAGKLRPVSNLSPLSNPGVPLPLTCTEGTNRQLPMMGEHETIDPVIAEAPEELTAQGGNQVGGYALFTQDDPRQAGSDLVLLFQLDGDYSGIELGDAGTMQFFIRPADLAHRDFSYVVMDWACY